MRAWLLVLASCTGTVAPRPDDPREVFDQVRRHYATARSCVDRGSITFVEGIQKAGQGHRGPTEPYELQFVRDGQWRLTFGRGADAIVIWADAQHTYVKVPENPRFDLGPDHAKAIAGLDKVTYGGATVVLALLLAQLDAPEHLVWAVPPDPHVAHLRGDRHTAPVEMTIARDRAELQVITLW